MGLKDFFFLILIGVAQLFTGCASTPNTEHSAFELVKKADRAYLESRWLEAEQGYSAVIQQVPEDPYAWFRLGNTQLRQGRVDSAIHAFNQALKRDPQHSKTHYNLATAYLLQALAALENSGHSLRDQDPGKQVIQQRIAELQQLMNQPLETRHSTGSLRSIHYGWKQ